MLRLLARGRWSMVDGRRIDGALRGLLATR